MLTRLMPIATIICFNFLLVTTSCAKAVIMRQPCCTTLKHARAMDGPESVVQGPLALHSSQMDPFACQGVHPQLNGTIALVPRGNCKFSDKVLVAQESGAIGVIVYNQVHMEAKDGYEGLITMRYNDVVDRVAIPAVFVSSASSKILRESIQGFSSSLVTQDSVDCSDYASTKTDGNECTDVWRDNGVDIRWYNNNNNNNNNIINDNNNDKHNNDNKHNIRNNNSNSNNSKHKDSNNNNNNNNNNAVKAESPTTFIEITKEEVVVAIGNEGEVTNQNRRKPKSKFSMYIIAHTCFRVGVLMWGVASLVFVLCWVREYYVLQKRFWAVKRLPTARYRKAGEQREEICTKSMNDCLSACVCTKKTSWVDCCCCIKKKKKRNKNVFGAQDCSGTVEHDDKLDLILIEELISSPSTSTASTTTRALVLAAAHSMGIHVSISGSASDELDVDAMHTTPAMLATKAKATLTAKAKTIATKAKIMADKAMAKKKVAPHASELHGGQATFFDCDKCVICLDEYVDEEVLVVLPCFHAYHKQCIEPWLISRSSLCPMCKCSIMR